MKRRYRIGGSLGVAGLATLRARTSMGKGWLPPKFKLTHYRKFWELYSALPTEAREVADKNYKLLKENPRHPSLRFKRVGKFWSVRAGLNHRALGVDVDNGILWIWIGTHAAYDKLTS